MSAVRSDVVIIGAGEASTFERIPGRTGPRLAAEAIAAALENAGIDKNEVDGLLAGYSLVGGGHMWATVICEYIGLAPRFHTSLVCGGATTVMMLEHAADAIRAGRVEVVVCVDADNRGSARGIAGAVEAMADAREHREFERPYGLHPASAEAMIAQRHMHDFGTTAEQLALVAVITREHASRNPKALRREPIGVGDVLDSPMVSTPLHALECSLLSNYGGAVIVTSAERAKTLTGRPPVYVLGTGEAYQHRYICQCPDLVNSATVQSSLRALAESGVSVEEIDFAQLYDGFAIDVIMSVEDIGFCAKGDGGAFIESRITAPDGRLPVNTFGGALSAVHGAIVPLTEAVFQLQGSAGDRQLSRAKVGLVHCIGNDYATHGTAVLGV
jgi:acetyl-CoA acetyltransferase